MADPTISTRTLTYRDPTVSAAQAAQLRRNQQRSFENLIERTQQSSTSAERESQVDRNNRNNNFQAVQDAADQTAAEEHITIQRQSKQTSASASRSTTGRQTDIVDDEQVESQALGAQSTATFTAQRIAQENLGIGLHVPPLKPADEAYRRAGAEPPLQTEIADPSLFALAI